MSATERLKKILEEHHTGPFDYHFKFIMPLSSVEDFSKLLPGVEMQSRVSANSKYMSLSFDFKAETAHAVVEIYERVKSIPGLLSL